MTLENKADYASTTQWIKIDINQVEPTKVSLHFNIEMVAEFLKDMSEEVLPEKLTIEIRKEQKGLLYERKGDVLGSYRYDGDDDHGYISIYPDLYLKWLEEDLDGGVFGDESQLFDAERRFNIGGDSVKRASLFMRAVSEKYANGEIDRERYDRAIGTLVSWYGKYFSHSRVLAHELGHFIDSKEILKSIEKMSAVPAFLQLFAMLVPALATYYLLDEFGVKEESRLRAAFLSFYFFTIFLAPKSYKLFFERIIEPKLEEVAEGYEQKFLENSLKYRNMVKVNSVNFRYEHSDE